MVLLNYYRTTTKLLLHYSCVKKPYCTPSSVGHPFRPGKCVSELPGRPFFGRSVSLEQLLSCLTNRQMSRAMENFSLSFGYWNRKGDSNPDRTCFADKRQATYLNSPGMIGSSLGGRHGVRTRNPVKGNTFPMCLLTNFAYLP